jgi:hypothetical protein
MKFRLLTSTYEQRHPSLSRQTQTSLESVVRSPPPFIMDVADYLVLPECDAISAPGSDVYQSWERRLGKILGSS